MVKGGESGPAIEPGKPEKSLLYQKVVEGEMPKREKKLSAQEIEIIKRWIADGAKTAHDEPIEPGKGLGITADDRAHWSFQTIAKPLLPKFKTKDRVRNAVDAFLFAELSKRKLSFSPDAEKVTLVRRAYFDLMGLPPSPEAVDCFLADKSPDAYERLIDELLNAPQYGERWARHWLDVAGYADSDGYVDADTPRNYAYKYRDYVIRSFNADKPFNQFVIEQLAGDELAGASFTDPHPALTNSESLEMLTATGFLRMAADGTAADAVDQSVLRNQVIADTIKIVSTSLMGLSLGCAQCHDHRYDPIPQADYYRVRAVFEPAFDSKNWKTPAQRMISLATEAEKSKAAEIEAEAKTLTAEKELKQKNYLEEALEKHLTEKFDDALRGPLRDAYHTAADKRTPGQKTLLADHPSVNIHPGVLYQYNQKAADDLKAMDARIAEIRARKPAEDFVSALTEVPGQVPVTYLLHRGDPKQPRDPIGPGGLTVLAAPGQCIEFPAKNASLLTTGRRVEFARWLVSEQHPLVARVIVNRIWMHHFGRGLVATPADFGFMGEKPTHPELLDWLAREFVEHGWSVKYLHKLIMTSTAYRQSSRRDPGKEGSDPDNRFYWRKPVQRLDAEVLRDAILATTGVLNPKRFGPPVPVREDAVGQIVVGIDKKEGDTKVPVDVPMGGEEFRRSVYIQVRRSKPLAFLNTFDAPVMDVNCERRQASTVATQALMLMNSDFILQQAAKFAERLQKEAGTDPTQQITRAWQLAFSRPATQNETSQSLDFLARQLEHLKSIEEQPPAEKSGTSGKKEAKEPPAKKVDPQTQALTDLSQALLSANEFLYVD